MAQALTSLKALPVGDKRLLVGSLVLAPVVGLLLGWREGLLAFGLPIGVVSTRAWIRARLGGDGNPWASIGLPRWSSYVFAAGMIGLIALADAFLGRWGTQAAALGAALLLVLVFRIARARRDR
jgi:hypothetical protein